MVKMVKKNNVEVVCRTAIPVTPYTVFLNQYVRQIHFFNDLFAHFNLSLCRAGIICSNAQAQ